MLFLYENSENNEEFRLSSHMFHCRKWIFVKEIDIKMISLSGDGHAMYYSESNGTFDIEPNKFKVPPDLENQN